MTEAAPVIGPPSTGSSGAEPAASGFSIKTVIHDAQKHWIIGLVVAAAVMLATTFYTLGEKPIYSAMGTLQFDPNPPQPLGADVQTVVDMGAGAFWNNQEYYQTQYEIIASQMVAKMVVRQLGLQRDAGFITNAAPEETVAPTEVNVDVAASILRGRLSVTPVPSSRLANVNYNDADPIRAQRVLRTLLDAYVQQNVDYMVESTASAGDWLRGQLAKLKGDLEVSERALHDFKLDRNILSVSADDQTNMLRSEIQKFNDFLTDTRATIASTDARLQAIGDVVDDPYNMPSSDLLESDALSALRKDFLSAERKLRAFQGSNKGALHPDVISANAELEITRNAMFSEMHNVRGALKSDAKALRIQEKTLVGLLAEAKKQALELNLMEIEYNRLQRTKNNTEKLYTVILERTKASDITRMLRVNNIRVLDPPLEPSTPISPKVPMNLAFGAIIGLLLGAGAAFGREQLDRSIKTPEDVERELQLPVLGILPEINVRETRSALYYARASKPPAEQAAPLTKPEFVVHEKPSSGPAEAARAIRTNIMFMSPDRPHKTLLLTSAGPHEGKTTVGCSIAIAMAQSGQRVLLLDCDLRRARIHKVFEKPNDFGVTSALLDPGLLDEVDLTTMIPNLSVLPAGPIPPNPAELLHSAAFARLLEDLQGRYDRILVDSPPIGPVTDATILSTKVDATILVVRAFKTKKELARRANKALQDVSARTVGCVLNAVDLNRPEYRQNYYYYYYREEGGYYNEGRESF